MLSWIPLISMTVGRIFPSFVSKFTALTITMWNIVFTGLASVLFAAFNFPAIVAVLLLSVVSFGFGVNSSTFMPAAMELFEGDASTFISGAALLIYGSMGLAA